MSLYTPDPQTPGGRRRRFQLAGGAPHASRDCYRSARKSAAALRPCDNLNLARHAIYPLMKCGRMAIRRATGFYSAKKATAGKFF